MLNRPVNQASGQRGQFGEITHQLSQLLDRVGVSASTPLDYHSTPASDEAQEVAKAVTEKLREAKERFQHPVGDSDIYNKLGYVAYGNQEYQEAVSRFIEAIQIDPDNAIIYRSRGNAYGQLGQDAKADADKAKACSLDSQYC